VTPGVNVAGASRADPELRSDHRRQICQASYAGRFPQLIMDESVSLHPLCSRPAIGSFSPRRGVRDHGNYFHILLFIFFFFSTFLKAFICCK
jgi:hypothetical protein